MRYPFGGDGSSAILDLNTGGLLTSATDGVAYASLTAVTPLADIAADPDGNVFLDHISTNAFGIPNRFYGPDNVTQVAVQFGAQRFILNSDTGLKRAMDLPQQVGDLQTTIANAVTTDDVGAVNGVAGLDATGRVPLAQLPSGIGSGGADLDQLVVNGQSPVGGTLQLSPSDIGAAPASGIQTSAVVGLETRLHTLEITPPAASVAAAGITDSTATGRALVTATDQAAARGAIGAGTSNLALGTVAGTAKAGNYQPAVADLSDGTATGRALVTAANAAAAKTTLALQNVDNTSDLAKPVSTAQAAAIAAAQPKSFTTLAAAQAAGAAGQLAANELFTIG